ncbi:MAG: hypothetical protein ACRYFS_08215 [Janthinobacterium lividum]
MDLQCEICGKLAVATALGGRLCEEHYPNERQCTRCGVRLWGWPVPPESDPCSTCQFRQRIPAMMQGMTEAEREAVHQHIQAGHRINAIKTLRETVNLPLKEAIELRYILYPS